MRKIFANQTIRHVSFIGGANLISIVTNMLSSIIIARYISPSDFGSVKIFFVLNTYFAISHLGVFDGMSRQIPLYFGKNNVVKAHKLASTGYTFVFFTSLVLTLVYVGISLYSLLFEKNYFSALGWFVAGLLFFLSQISACLSVTYRTTSDFSKMSMINVATGVVSLFSVGLVVIFSVIGLFFKNLVAAMLNTYLYYRNRPFKIPMKFEKEELYELLKIGSPLFIGGYLNSSFWVAFDTTLAYKYSNADEFGIYMFLLVIYMALNSITMAVKQIYSPKLTFQYGAGVSVFDCFLKLKKPVFLLFCAVLLLSTANYLISPLLIRLIMPKYVASLDYIFLLSIMLIVEPLQMYSLILVTTHKWQQNIIAILIGLLTYTGTFFILRLRYDPILALIIANTVGRFVQYISVIIISFRIQLVEAQKQVVD